MSNYDSTSRPLTSNALLRQFRDAGIRRGGSLPLLVTGLHTSMTASCQLTNQASKTPGETYIPALSN